MNQSLHERIREDFKKSVLRAHADMPMPQTEALVSLQAMEFILTHIIENGKSQPERVAATVHLGRLKGKLT